MHQEISVVLATGDELLRPVVGELPQARVTGLVYLAEQVVEVVAEVRPQVLILADFMDSGLETVKVVRHQYPGTRIIYIITGEDEERVRGVLIKLGIYDFLPHTFKKSELLKLVQYPRGWQDLCSAGLLLDDLIAEPSPEIKGPGSPAARALEVEKPAEGSGGFAAFFNNMVGGVGRDTGGAGLREAGAATGIQESGEATRVQASGDGAGTPKKLGRGPERFAPPAIRVIKQQVVAFWSGKPGVGKTFLAVNTALALARAGVKVALVDGDILNLSVGVFLNLQDVRKTLERALKVNDPRDIADLLLYHPQFPNLAVLTGSDLCRPEGYCTVDKEAVARLIQYLKGEFDVVILDTTTDVQSVTTYVALQQANRVLLVTNQDYAQVFATKRQLALLKRLRQPLDKFQLVLNSELKGCKITTAMLEDILGLKVVQVLPHLPKQVLDSIFDSRPVVLQKGQEILGLREGLESLAQEIIPVITEEKVSLLENLSRLLRKKGSMTYG
ncbi:MAG: AAA family ATPase [Clostridia bacterium]|nr:AAA family ATPase [Clostridia bacterium]